MDTVPPLGGHTPVECSAAFKWLQALATADDAPPEAGVALGAWHAAVTELINLQKKETAS